MASKQLKDYIENGNVKNSVNLPNLSLEKSAKHRYTVISSDDKTYGGVSATRNGLRYTIIDSDELLDCNALGAGDAISFRQVY